jgi:hypothetical protein
VEKRCAGQQAPVDWPTLSCAVALLTRQQTSADISRADLLDGHAPGQVLEVLEDLAEVLLECLFPADQGAQFLQGLGSIAVLQAARQAAGGPE